MATSATALNPAPSAAEAATLALSEEDLNRLQEIHELVNLLMKELPLMAQASANSAAPPSSAYAYSFVQTPWGRPQFSVLHGI